MPEAIADTSPLVFLSKIDSVDLLEALFDAVWIPEAVRAELRQGEKSGHKSIPIEGREWARPASPASPPSEWLALDLGPGELAAMSLALEHPERVVLLDDMLARRVAEAAELKVWGTLRILLESKRAGHLPEIAPKVNQLVEAGMWISGELRQRILRLAGEAERAG